jgi:uncharacterized protein (DUF433 family)
LTQALYSNAIQPDIIKRSLGENAMFDRISIDPKICHGQACIKGTRIPVHQIAGMLASGDTFESLLKAYPTITREDISASLEYAAKGEFRNKFERVPLN